MAASGDAAAGLATESDLQGTRVLLERLESDGGVSEAIHVVVERLRIAGGIVVAGGVA